MAGKNKQKMLYYILSKLEKHAIGVVSETETELVIQKLAAIEKFNPFSNSSETVIDADSNYPQRTESKNDFSKVFNDCEITKDYWQVFEYLTGIKKPAIKVI